MTQNTPKPIDLENPPDCLQTQTGRHARILGRCHTASGFMYAVAISSGDTPKTGESLYMCTRDGQEIFLDHRITALRLIRAPVKREGWVNIYNDDGECLTGTIIHDTEDAAKHCGIARRKIAVAHITWEEEQ